MIEKIISGGQTGPIEQLLILPLIIISLMVAGYQREE